MVGNINQCLQCCEECCEELKHCPGCEEQLAKCEQIKQQLTASKDASGVRGLDYMSLALQLFLILLEVLKKRNQSQGSPDPVQAAAEKGFNDAMEK